MGIKMNKKTVVQFTVLTFIIRFLFGGGLVVCEQLGFMMNEYPLLNLPLGAIHKISGGNIFLCVLFHCMINAGMSTIMPNRTTSGVIITSIIMIVASILAVFINNHNFIIDKDV